jgi:putative Holliday junction resolvase
MKLLGVDFGFKRIGLAVTDSAVALPSAKPTLDAAGSLRKDAIRIAEIAKRENVEAVVIGLPLEDGEEGRMARICRQLAENLERDHGLKTFLVDETLTSVAAEEMLLSTGMKASQRKKHRDGEAAARILERYLNETQA